jgi:hypothetical protein
MKTNEQLYHMYYDGGQPVAAVKALREQTGCTLRDAVYAFRERTIDNVLNVAAERDARLRLEAAAPQLLALVQRVAALNRDAGEIGAGMLASLVDDARTLIAMSE